MTPCWRIIVTVIAFLSLQCSGFLEEPIIQFHHDASSIPIAWSDILCSQDDETGVHIAAANLATDLEQITGIKRRVLEWQNPDSPSWNRSDLETVIIAGSLNSSLIRHLRTEGIISVSDLEGKWESFTTTVVDKPLPNVQQALAIVGSDKRGTIFGLYTLSEQSGQSP